jgi:hypothetical protein
MIDFKMKTFISNQIVLKLNYGLVDKKEINKTKVDDEILNFLKKDRFYPNIFVANRACVDFWR